MKAIKQLTAIVLLCGIIGDPLTAIAADKEEKKVEKVKPYPLEKRVVSDEKLGSMGAPYVITNNNQEVKFCCKSCLKDFKKDTAKYTKKIEAAKTRS